ncbi:MAG: hypothetical protein M1822_004825 [Bathelium mastoideum]|nr:MAG: hypothetical protein M1822_004825 [Bathelium mastoideum]
MAESQNLAIPMKLDAFVFNSKVCEGGDGKAKIAPITQPNYTFLRVTQHLAQNDILDPIDLHNAWPAKRNSRLTDIARGTTRQNRLGVYLHWIAPRPFRSGASATQTAKEAGRPSSRTQTQDPQRLALEDDHSAPTFHYLPNRWLVIRTLDPTAPTTSPQNAPIPSVQAWVIESDKTDSIDDLGPEVDLQVDKSPFITSFVPVDKKPENISIQKQAEVFIGQCTDARVWTDPVGAQEVLDRIELTATSSSNQLFMDFQYHNGNVFSMLDNFAYQDGGETKYLQAAHANYYVIGWQGTDANDVLNINASNSLSEQSRRARVGSLGLVLNETLPNDKDVTAWLASTASSRNLCHGAMYEVEWSTESLPPTVPADAFADVMADRIKPPIAVGTTPMDSILSYVSTRAPTDDTEASIAKLQALLRAADDSIDAHVAAEDEVQSYNYSNMDGGSFFYLPGPDASAGKNVGNEPSQESQDHMRVVNGAQRLLDNAARRIKQIKWELFSCWWRSISDIDEAGNSVTYVVKEDYADTISNLTRELSQLKDLVKSLQKRVVRDPQPPTKKGVVEDFHQRNDPTLMLAGLESSWPKDFSERLKARLDDQIVPNADIVGLSEDYGWRCLPSELTTTGVLLIKEFLKLTSLSEYDVPKPKDGFLPVLDGGFLPLYHDGIYKGELSDNSPWRDRWMSTQSWFPLYLEWEAEYVHIPFKDWDLKSQPRSKVPKTAPPIAFTLNKDVDGKTSDNRLISGRSVILPQPSFSLKTHLERLLETVPKELDSVIGGEETRKKLFAHLERLAFLSMPLAGLTDHLSTRFQGSHIKPLVRVPGKKPLVLDEVADLAAEIGIARDQLAEIDAESDPTPYGSLPSLVGRRICAFKPVTHGQMRLTKLNVVDKFGQVVHALDPKDDKPKALYPNTGDFLAVDPLPTDGDGPSDVPNVVDRSRSASLKQCEFIQLPPSINQPARLNAHFVRHGDATKGEAKWRPVTEWENPIWGWLVINYVDNGIQIFQPDGTFYREVRVTAGSAGDLKWLPFAPPKISSPSTQLDFLISKMTDPDNGKRYLRALMNMVSSALASVVPAPSAYSQFMNSLVGRPLALVNMGWSLELDSKPRTNQSTVKDQSEANAPLQRGLLYDETAPLRPLYEFPIKLGDRWRNYDGLVGYFEPDKKPAENGDLDLNYIFTYFGLSSNPDPDKDLLQPIDGKPYPTLKPFWLDPEAYIPDEPTNEAYATAAQAYERNRDSKLRIFGALIDPFSPVTGFSSILPVRTLTLPPWTWESALKKMTTFFHAGPLLVTSGVPAYDPAQRLDEDYNLAEKEPAGKVQLPALQAADWNWLQPYEGADYMALGVQKDEMVSEDLKSGPMLAVEGYMQLRQPIERDRPLEKPVTGTT